MSRRQIAMVNMGKTLCAGLVAGLFSINAINVNAAGLSLPSLAVGDLNSSVKIKDSTIDTDVNMGKFTNSCEGLICAASGAVGSIGGGRVVEVDNSTFKSRVKIGDFDNHCKGLVASCYGAVGSVSAITPLF